MSDTPETTGLAAIQAAIAAMELHKVITPPDPPPFEPVEMPSAAVEDRTTAQLHAQFRNDMRAAGYYVQEVEEDMLGQRHIGPAINVRDPQHAIAATRLLLASHAISPGLWRMYPVPEPITL